MQILSRKLEIEVLLSDLTIRLTNKGGYTKLRLRCGWYVLHFMEQEIRNFRGESGTVKFNLELRAKLLKKFRARLLGEN